jgi:catechol 2,3-dioxygenase-like lactoylglutathione lyase family enzyme
MRYTGHVMEKLMRNSAAAIAAIFEDLDPASVTAIRRPEPLLRARALAWLRFERPDLDRQRAFLDDFGLPVVHQDAEQLFAAGSDGAPYCYHAVRGAKARFLGIGLELESAGDLAIAAQFGGAQPVAAVTGPGGGQFVRVINPDGIAVDFVHGRSKAEPQSATPAAPFPATRANAPARPPLEPSGVIGLGHVVLQCTDFDATLQWWMRHTGIIVSDAQVLADGSVNLAFCRLDRGDTPSDHHSIAIAGGIGSIYMHSAYEVRDADAVGQGQQVLKARGWRHGWGMGRHYYGSQIFDYWRDPYGALMEHYTDGDKYDAHQPTRYSRFSRGSTWMWGPDQPKDFDGVGPAEIVLLLRNMLAGKIKWGRIKLVLASLKSPPRPWLK